MNKPFRVFGHRGACGYEPENTLASFRKALQLGAKWVEFDVRIVEGAPIVFHDRDTLRRTGHSALLEGMDLAHVRSLDAGNGERIPLLREALDLLQGNAGANIELKGKGDVEPVAAEIRAALDRGWRHDDLLISSFDHHKLKAVAKLLPQIPRAVLTYGDPLFPVETAREVDAGAVVMHYDGVSAERISELNAAGRAVYVYTVNSVRDIAWVRDLGADGVFCDYPDRALPYAR